LQEGRFVDDRWVGGRWDLSMFKDASGETNWDAVSTAQPPGSPAASPKSALLLADGSAGCGWRARTAGLQMPYCALRHCCAGGRVAETPPPPPPPPPSPSRLPAPSSPPSPHTPLQVIDAEMARRKLLEDSPIPSTNEDAVIFDTAEIPWWVAAPDA